jgi:hypothetical protein
VPSRGQLTERALNRALLARQHLLARANASTMDTVVHLVGMQAQSPQAPFVGLWTRLDPYDPAELSSLLLSRAVVRITLMRGTVHLVSAEDCALLRPLTQPVIDRGIAGAFGRHLRELDRDEFTAAARELVEQHPRSAAELGALLSQRWPGRDAAALGNAARAWIPMVQVPPRGVFGRGGAAAYTTADSWLGRDLTGPGDPDTMVLRYLAAFGPARVADIQSWSGLTRLREVVERLRPALAVFGHAEGGELFDLPDAPRPDPQTPSPVRFLPEWDNAILAYDDRTRIVAAGDRDRVFMLNNQVVGTVLVDGFVRATWKTTRGRGAATLTVTPLARLSTKDVRALAAEGERLLAFTDAGAGTREVVIARE